MHALTYTEHPATVINEASRVLRPGGKLLAVTLLKHQHEKAVEPYNHVNLGFTTRQLENFVLMQACRFSPAAYPPSKNARPISRCFPCRPANPEPQSKENMTMLPYKNADIVARLEEMLAQRILVIDGAMGTMIQAVLSSGKRFPR